jgi:hypothetical protein
MIALNESVAVAGEKKRGWDHLMSNSNEPSCWRAAALTFAVLGGLVLVAGLIAGGDVTAVALR